MSKKAIFVWAIVGLFAWLIFFDEAPEQRKQRLEHQRYVDYLWCVQDTYNLNGAAACMALKGYHN